MTERELNYHGGIIYWSLQAAMFSSLLIFNSICFAPDGANLKGEVTLILLKQTVTNSCVETCPSLKDAILDETGKNTYPANQVELMQKNEQRRPASWPGSFFESLQ